MTYIDILGIIDGGDSVISESITSSYCLKLPGKNLHLTALLYAKKFRNHGYKTGALSAFRELESFGLGRLDIKKTKTGTVSIPVSILYIIIINFCFFFQQYIFSKVDMPSDSEEKTELAKKLKHFNISLLEYSFRLNQKEIV